MLVECFNLNNIPHDLESCVTNFSIWGYQLSLSSNITPRYVKLLCFDIGWWLIETEKFEIVMVVHEHETAFGMIDT